MLATLQMCAYCFDIIIDYLVPKSKPKIKLIPSSWKKNRTPLFVTWSKYSYRQLRGCIGTFESMRLDQGLQKYARFAAFHDSRFVKIDASEIPDL